MSASTILAANLRLRARMETDESIMCSQEPALQYYLVLITRIKARPRGRNIEDLLQSARLQDYDCRERQVVQDLVSRYRGGATKTGGT